MDGRGHIDKIYERVKRNRPYPALDGITTTMDILSRAVNGSEKTVSGTSLAVGWFEPFQETTILCFIALVHDIADEDEANVSQSVLRLTFVNSGCMVDGSPRTLRDVDLDKGHIGELEEYKRRLQREFSMDISGTAGNRKNSIMLVCSGSRERDGLWATNVLLIFRQSVRGDSESRKYSFLQ